MTVLYYNYNGVPAKIHLDDHETPDSCEIYDREAADFIKCDAQTLDVYDSHISTLITEDDFLALLDKVR